MLRKEKKYDQAIKKITQSEDYPCPSDFSERMKLLYKRLPEGNGVVHGRWTAWRIKTGRITIPYFRYGFIAASVACLFLVVMPVAADLHGHWGRMAAMQDSEKRQYVSDMEQSPAGGDSYSRDLTPSEGERLKELTQVYEEGEMYPEGQVVSVDSHAQVPQGQIGFCAESSTFYLPESEMTDEQLLEIIDFRHKREYSLAEKGERGVDAKNGGQVESSQSKEMTAVALGEEWIDKIYGVRVTGWENIVVKPDDSAEDYYITYREDKTPAEYYAAVHEAEITQLQCVYNGKADNETQGLSVMSKKSIRRKYKEVKQLAAKFDDSRELVSGSCRYIVDTGTRKLAFGTLSFILEYEDGTALQVSYSLNSREYYQFECSTIGFERNRSFSSSLNMEEKEITLEKHKK